MKDSEIFIEMYQDLLELANESEEDRLYKETNSVKAPEWMKSAARRGIKLREKQPPSNRCCTATGMTRANQIVEGKPLSLSTIKRMKSFAARHGGSTNFNDKESKGVQALLIWGVPASKSGVERVIKWCDAQINKLSK